jgi:hypothetical protein
MVALVATAATLAVPMARGLFRLVFSELDNKKAQSAADSLGLSKKVDVSFSSNSHTLFSPRNNGSGQGTTQAPTAADIKHVDVPRGTK